MSEAYPILRIEEVQPVVNKATLGLVPLQTNGHLSIIEASLDAVADGTPPPVPEWNEEYDQSAIAVSYVHAQPYHWYGRISRGKFLSGTKQRLVREIVKRRPQAIWLDQCLAQRKGAGDAGWAVLGLLPYGTMPVLVIGNFRGLHEVLQSYIELERFTKDVLSVVTDELEPLLESLWPELSASSTSSQDHQLVVDFVEMCRFWPMMERALAHKAKGLWYEQHTLTGLRRWIESLSLVKQQLLSWGQAAESSSVFQFLKVILGDLQEMVQYILMQRSDEDHHEGLGHSILTALSIVTGALGSGALMNTKLYQPADREALLLAGMCFNLFANVPLRRGLLAQEIVQIIEDPYRAFGRISERIPATYNSTALALVGANVLYNRAALDQPAVLHAGVTDEVTIFSGHTAQVPISRRWNGQWELIPHLSLSMRAHLIDIGERSMNSEPYDDIIMRQCVSTIDITGKAVQAVLCGAPLTEKNTSIPMMAISLFSATWTLRSLEKEIFAKHGLGGWTSRIVFLGMCDTIRKHIAIEAMIVAHMTTAEEDQLVEGRIAQSPALRWLNALIRRSSCPLDKGVWIQNWVSSHFDGVSYTWYSGRQTNDLHHFTWEKWVARVPPSSREDIVLKNSVVKVKFVRLSCVTIETLATGPQLPLEDVIRFVQVAMLLSQKRERRDSQANREIGNEGRQFLQHTFETWLGLVTGLYRAYELQNGIKEASHLQLMLPGCNTSSEKVELSCEDVLKQDSGFFEGLARTLSSFNRLDDEIERRHLLWDKRLSGTFWEAKEIILSTAHTEGMMLTLTLICLAKAACETQARSSSADPDCVCQQGAAAQGSEHVLVYQIDHAIRKLSIRLAHSRVTQDIVYSLIEQVVTNARLSTQQCDWRIQPELRRHVVETVISSGSSRSTAIVSQIQTVFESLDTIHATICHVREANIEVRPGESFVEGTENSFDSMLHICRPRGDSEHAIARPSISDVLGHADLKEVIRTLDVDIEATDTSERKQKELVVTYEFLARSES